jgi:16S rRNA processing protein RimM
LNEFVAIAVVTSIAAKDGLLKIKLFSEDKQQILNQDFVYFDFFGNIRKILIEEVVYRSGSYLVKLKNFAEERELEVFLNKEILILKNQVMLDKNAYLISDLIGCKVYFRKKYIGEVENVLDVPMNYVLEIRQNKKELMIPFVLKFFDSIDIEKRIIYLSKESRFLYDEN